MNQDFIKKEHKDNSSWTRHLVPVVRARIFVKHRVFAPRCRPSGIPATLCPHNALFCVFTGKPAPLDNRTFSSEDPEIRIKNFKHIPPYSSIFIIFRLSWNASKHGRGYVRAVGEGFVAQWEMTVMKQYWIGQTNISKRWLFIKGSGIWKTNGEIL